MTVGQELRGRRFASCGGRLRWYSAWVD